MTRDCKVTPGMLETLKAEAVADLPHIIAACTASKGERRGLLKTSKPGTNGLHQYVWRMVRFHSGADMTMPMCCQFDLLNWIESHGEVWGYCSPELRELESFIETTIIDRVCVAVKGNPYVAAQRWGRALGWLG